MEPWIKIENGLPADYEAVLVYAEMKGTGEPCTISIAYRHAGKWEMLNYSPNNAVANGDIFCHMDESDITHWIPLPKTPKEKTHE